MTAEVVKSISDLRTRVAELRRDGRTIALVPTMGALHAGHARLIEAAREACGSVVVSIFVNPRQFDRADDLQRYPRPLDEDVQLCRRMGVDLVFAPEVAEMYPAEPRCEVEVKRLADHLCGPHRPGHFQSVATVVLKLFEIVRPDRAYFGEKDIQQLAVIRRLVQDFNIPVNVVGIPTVREADGLALSSRNQRLAPEERQLATALHSALVEASRQIGAGMTDSESIKEAARKRIPENPAVRLEYLEIVDPDEMQPVHDVMGTVVVAGALWVGSTRLIDNLICHEASNHL